MNAAVFAGGYSMGPERSLVHGVSGPTREVPVVQEMLATLDTLTAAGQRHTMGKVVSFISDAIKRLGSSVSLRNRSTLTELLSRLAHESERRSPDVQRFRGSADSLLELLSDLV